MCVGARLAKESARVVCARRLKGVIAGLLLLAAWQVAAGAAAAAELVRGDPASLGFDPAALAAIDQRIDTDAKNGRFPGAALAIVRRDHLVHWRSYGRRTPDGGEPMPDDAIYRIYSMTKPITSIAVMQLVEAGKLKLKAPLSDYLPQFADMKVYENGTEVPARRPITIADLLRHTSGLTYDFTGDSHVHQLYREHDLPNTRRTCAEFVTEIAALPLLHHPGVAWAYSMSTDVLGCVVEVVSGMPLDRYLKAHLFEPLGMVDTDFHVSADQAGRVAEPNAGITLTDAVEVPRLERGGAGLLSTMSDYLRFTRMLANGGSLDGVRVIGADTLAQMTRNHLTGGQGRPATAYGFGYGFEVRIADAGSDYPGNIGDYGWSGSAGTTFWIDPVAELIVVFMVQAPDLGPGYRIWLRQAVYGALEG